MSTSPSRVYAARLVGLPIFDPQGDQVGKVRDLVVVLRHDREPPRVLGLVMEVQRRRIFLPMTRVNTIDAGQVVVNAIKLATKPDGQALFTQLGFHRAQRSDR